jgi:hypothetical protein
MNSDQEKILSAIEDEASARILREIWTQIEGEPLAAARMLRAFQSAKSVITDTLKELPEKWNQLEEELTKADLHRARFVQDLRDFRKDTSSELADAMKDVGGLVAFFEKIDEDKFLNKANRVLELCERMSRARRDGTLEVLERLLKP